MSFFMAMIDSNRMICIHMHVLWINIVPSLRRWKNPLKMKWIVIYYWTRFDLFRCVFMFVYCLLARFYARKILWVCSSIVKVFFNRPQCRNKIHNSKTNQNVKKVNCFSVFTLIFFSNDSWNRFQCNVECRCCIKWIMQESERITRESNLSAA